MIKLEITEDGYPLGQWIHIQKRFHAMKNTDKVDPLIRMSEERIKKLESIPGWEWDKDAADWLVGFDCSIEHGTVAENFVTEDGFELGKWQARYRKEHAYGYTAWRKLLELYVKGWYW